MRAVTIAPALLFLGTSIGLAQTALPTVTRRLAIGCESCGGLTQFGSIWDVSVSASGDILVTDRDAPMLRRFDVDGRATWSGGRMGKGPGEYTLPVRAALVSNGMTVVDMTNRRVTDLSIAGTVSASTPVINMPMAASVNDRGTLLVGSDDFRGSFKVFRRDPGGTLLEQATLAGSTGNASLALAGDGSSAVLLDTKSYVIQRFDPAGKPQRPITRAIPQVRRTQEEEAEFRDRLNRVRGMVAAEAKRAGGSPSAPAFGQDELSLKNHLTIDGLRFDGIGRLWALTQRGSSRTSIFDVFSSAGDFVGSVTIPIKVQGYSLAGSWMVTSGETEDGVPVVSLWSVR